MKGNVVETRPGIVWVKHEWLCKEFKAHLPEDVFFAIPNREGYICMSKSKLDGIKARHSNYSQKMSLLNKTTELNNQGRDQEKTGNIIGAIDSYEKCIALGYDAYFAYDRLMILYRKIKDYENEERIAMKALSMFNGTSLYDKYKQRLEKVKALKNKSK